MNFIKITSLVVLTALIYSCGEKKEEISCSHPEVTDLLKSIALEGLDSTKYTVKFEGIRASKMEKELKKCHCSTDAILYKEGEKLKETTLDYTGQFTEDDQVVVEIVE